ncbi:MAG: arsenic transporter [Caulobacteraceae bacterium]|nr:arsenic transporter [Caulobacteraceae bacterium]
MPHAAVLAVWIIAAGVAAGLVLRPFRLPEAVWAAAGATLLAASGLAPPSAVAEGLLKSGDVCLFLVGMMLLAELGRREGLFDWAAGWAARWAGGEPGRLFLLVYAVGVVVTVFLSNDATAVVLTPAVFAAARRARATPLPYLLACAFVANAASFVLPIANPANLVLYAGAPPPLGAWLARFGLASIAAVAATFAALRWSVRRSLEGACAQTLEIPPLSAAAWGALAALAVTAAVLLTASARGWPLGAPTAVMGVLATAAVCLMERKSPAPVLKAIAWSVPPLVAGLFVVVEALDRTGLTDRLARLLTHAAHRSPALAAWASGVSIALGGNLTNNLPAGLLAASTLARNHAPPGVADALLIGVDLGPNLSVTGSLATLLWLIAVRREGETITYWRFLKFGAVVTPPALVLALAARLWLG